METVHLDDEGGGAVHMAHEGTLPSGRQGIERGAVEMFARVVPVDGEVAHTKRGEVLEEVCALRWLYVAPVGADLGDEAHGRDVGPLHGYA